MNAQNKKAVDESSPVRGHIHVEIAFFIKGYRRCVYVHANEDAHC